MKLATLKNGTRDGQLIVVSKNLQIAVKVDDIANTLQKALDNWDNIQPKLNDVYQSLNQGHIHHAFKFNSKQVMSPLPRAYQWADGSAYVNHVELVRKARGATMPESFWSDPLIYQGGSDSFIGPCDDILIENEAWGIDFEAEIAIITEDVPMGTPLELATHKIALLMLANDLSLRNLIPSELAKGFGFFQSKPATSFSPVAVTPDELEQAWDGKKVHLPISSYLNNKLFGAPNAGIDMTFDFPSLITHAAKTRALCAGSIIGSGTVSNYDRTKGGACIAEIRMLETLSIGKAITPFMRFGDTIKIEMLNQNHENIFGSINQQISKYQLEELA